MATSAIPTAKAALVTALATAMGDTVQVSYGHPGPTVVEDLVAVTDGSGEQTNTVMGTARPREELLRLVVVISCYRGGGPEVQQTVTERAFALLGLLESSIRTDPTIGGTVRKCLLESYDLLEAADPEVLASGRVTEITAVVAAEARL